MASGGEYDAESRQSLERERQKANRYAARDEPIDFREASNRR